MRKTASAFDHEVTEGDMDHAVSNYLFTVADQGDAEVLMFIGPAADGMMLEVGVAEPVETPGSSTQCPCVRSSGRDDTSGRGETMSAQTKRPLTDVEALARLEQLSLETGVVRDRGAVGLIEAGVKLRNAADESLEAAVRLARQHGVTWAEIAVALGVSHQAAMKRYRDKIGPITRSGAPDRRLQE